MRELLKAATEFLLQDGIHESTEINYPLIIGISVLIILLINIVIFIISKIRLKIGRNK